MALKINMLNVESGTVTIPCIHKRGWYGNIHFWIFKRKVFACSDCGQMFYGKRLRDLEWKWRTLYFHEC